MILESSSLNFILAFAAVLLVCGVILSYLSKNAQQTNTEDDLVAKLNAALPGAQCAQCGYPGCEAYAKALAHGEVTCNKCIPGGPDTIEALASILGIEPPQDEDGDDYLFMPRTVAFIHKSPCTGCSRCARICPVDAINGAIRQTHSVDPELCTGCGECVKTCPEECIEMIKLEPTPANFNWDIKSIRITGGK